MKKEKILSVLCGVFLLLALAFFGLWRREANTIARRDDLHKLWDASAVSACQLLEEYRQTGGEDLLRQAAAETAVLSRVAGMLPGVDSAGRTDLDAVCAMLLRRPEWGAEETDGFPNSVQWTIALEMMENEGPDTAYNWPVKVNELRHLLESGDGSQRG